MLPKKKNTTASTEPGNQNSRAFRRTAEPAAVVTVRVETMLPDPLTVVGVKLQVAPAGRPEQVNATVDVVGNPFCGVTVTVSVPLLPVTTVREGAESPSVKSAPGALTLVTVSTAALLWIDPVALLTVTVSCASLSLAVVAGVVYVAEVAPEIAAPFLAH